ncbi:hypothetical protein [Sulfurimonas sp.]|uniref:hypothetical protein n=1 Tax=Sulfurimonas sp. TaxID=2022749 RepID=UPI003D1128B4
MLLFGHRFIQSQRFYHIFDIEDITHTPPSSKIYVEFSQNNLDIIQYLQQNNISYGINVKNITELIYASALGADFIMVQKSFAKTAQNIAENYLFDAKILVHIEQEDQIEEFALLGIDGVIFAEAIVKIS